MQIPHDILETAVKVLRKRAEQTNLKAYRDHYNAKADMVESWIGRDFNEQQEIEAVKQLLDLQAIHLDRIDFGFRIVR